MIKILDVEYITDKEASQRYGYSVAWFQRARCKKQSPPYIKMNGKVLYEIKKLDEWFKNHITSHE